MSWRPRVTVAAVIERDGRYLMVEERDRQTGRRVFNQPAGHLEPGETLPQAALRETLEETRWQVELAGVLGIGLYTAPASGLTYHRTTFLARPVAHLENATLDPDIDRVHWLSYEEIRAESAKLRSPLVLASIERQRRGLCYPLDLVYAP
jgi:8-oxo-dGTP pyrophosphatase MutT (NUDIX family)